MHITRFCFIITATETTPNTMKQNLNAFGYYGGKYSKAAWIIRQLDTPHYKYVELFCGSLAVLLNKKRADVEIVNDLSQEVATFWRVMRDRKQSKELIQTIMKIPAGEVEYKRILSLPTNNDVEAAIRFYVVVNQSFNNIISAKGGYSFYASENYKSARKRLEKVVERVEDITVECTDATRLVKRIIAVEQNRQKQRPILFYCDPPYVDTTRASTGQYLQDDFDHAEFLKTISDAPDFCRFAVSGYENNLYNDALSGWYKAENKVAVTSSVKHGGKFNTECLWRNYSVVDSPKQSILL